MSLAALAVLPTLPVRSPVSAAAAGVFLLAGALAVAVLPVTEDGRRYRRLLAIIFGASVLSYGGVALGYGQLPVAGTTTLGLHYLEWLLGTPAYIWGLFVLTGDGRTARLAVGLDLVMVLTGFIASILAGAIRFVFFASATLALVGLFVALVTSEGAGGWQSTLFRDLRRLFLLFGPAYPLVWLVGFDGLGYLGFASTNLAFLALDLTVKLGFAALVVRDLGGSAARAGTPA